MLVFRVEDASHDLLEGVEVHLDEGLDEGRDGHQAHVDQGRGDEGAAVEKVAVLNACVVLAEDRQPAALLVTRTRHHTMRNLVKAPGSEKKSRYLMSI